MKIKSAAIFLMVSSIIWALSDIYWNVHRFTGDNWLYYKDKPLDLILSSLTILAPISLILLAIALMKNNIETVGAQKNKGEILQEDDIQNIAVGDWLINFLIASIPFIGIIFVILWANDDDNKIKKNWAIASLIWSGILIVIFVFLYATVFSVMMRRY